MSIDRATASDAATITPLPAGATKAEAIEFARERGAFVLEGRARVEKYHVGEAEPYEVIDSEPNLFLTAGITNLWNLAAGLTGTTWAASTARLAVGTGTTAAVVGNTTLQTESARQPVDAAPTVSGNAITFVATFGTGAANVNWREVGVTNAGTGGTFLNRLVQDFGTKTSSASWVLSLTLSIS